MTLFVLAFLIGIVAGLRTMTAPAAVSWAARLGWLHLQGTPLAFLGAAVTPYVATVLAIGELINDPLPKTGSRKAPPQFIGRILTGALSGAAIGESAGMLAGGLAGRRARSGRRDPGRLRVPGAPRARLRPRSSGGALRRRRGDRSRDSRRDPLFLTLAYAGSSSPRTVGTSSDTVGWMCMARWITV